MQIKKILAVIAAAAVTFTMGITAFADDSPAEEELEVAEEVSIEDEIRKGEGYYECHIIYHGGVPQIYSEDGDIYDMVGMIGGHVKEGETRESIEKDAAESIRNDIAATGADPDDYGFEVYVYFYDDYDYTPIEFLNFISDDIARRESERTAQTEEVPNPVTGNSFPYGALFLAAASLSCMKTAASMLLTKRKFSQRQ
ncbi:MAG: hypothetical protein K2N71_08170 [Oscillospiraceae bacterium]|nr:hypothetical protein [Oscillospiraceae bacterium]